jgi:TPR repeat protein
MQTNTFILLVAALSAQLVGQAQTFPIPATPPPMGVPNAQRAEAERLWAQAVALIDRNNPRAAMPVLYKCALLGDRRAEATLGIRYQDGDGVKADARVAAYWFGLAAAQGHRASQYALGGMYEEGEGGLPKDQAKATALYMKSANQGYDKAQLALGICYEFGESVPRDRSKAIALIRQSGLAREIADVLANPQTPKSFPSEAAFAAYLNDLRRAQMARAQGGMRPAGNRRDPYFDPNSDYNRLKRWDSRPRCENWGCKN